MLAIKARELKKKRFGYIVEEVCWNFIKDENGSDPVNLQTWCVIGK